MISFLLTSSFALGGNTFGFPTESTIVLNRQHVLVSDLLVGRQTPIIIKEHLKTKRVFSLPDNGEEIILSEKQIAALLSKTIPALKYKPSGPEDAFYTFRMAPKTPPPNTKNKICYESARSIESGAMIFGSDVIKRPCETFINAVAFDKKDQALRATKQIEPGQTLGRIFSELGNGVDRGETLTIEYKTGRIAVNREVVTLQPGIYGQQIFVQTSDKVTLNVHLNNVQVKE